MVLPIYASLERVDPSLIEAAKDLYASSRAGLRQGHAAPLDARRRRGHPADLHPRVRRLRQCLLPRRPEQHDDRQRHPGALPEQRDYPAAAALSFVLMAVIMVIVFVYIRFAGSEALMGEEAASRSDGSPSCSGPHVRAPRIGAARAVGVAREARAQHLRRAGDRVHADPDRGDHRLLLQRPGGQVQLHLGGVHAQALGCTSSAPGPQRRACQEPRLALFATLDLHDHRHDDRPRPRALRLLRPPRLELPDRHPHGDARGRDGRLAAVVLPDLRAPRSGSRP